MKTFGIIGLGPCGAILGAHLAAAGHAVHGVDVWGAHREAISGEGVRIDGFLDLRHSLAAVHERIEGLKGTDPDAVFIAVKTPYLDRVVQEVVRLGDGFRVISFQNGIDNEEFIARHIDRGRVMRMAINFAGNVQCPGTIRMTFFHKPNYVGCLCGKGICGHAKELAEIMTAAGLETRPTEDIRMFTWRKTILNAALSAVSAILGMTMSEVMGCKETFHLVEMILKECIAVARAEGYDYGEAFLEYSLDYLSNAGPHKPSMLVDLEGGRPTEIDYINGKIAACGHEKGIPAPINTALTALVKAKELAVFKSEALAE